MTRPARPDPRSSPAARSETDLPYDDAIDPSLDADGDVVGRGLGRFSYAHEGTMVSGTTSFEVGRTSGAEVIFVVDADEERRQTMRLRQAMTDADAVAAWLEHVDGWMDFVGSWGFARAAAVAKYRDGVDIWTAADLDPQESDSIDIALELEIGDDDIAQVLSKITDGVDPSLWRHGAS